MIVADASNSFELTGNGDVLESESGAIGIGSGGTYALGISFVLISCFRPLKVVNDFVDSHACFL